MFLISNFFVQLVFCLYKHGFAYDLGELLRFSLGDFNAGFYLKCLNRKIMRKKKISWPVGERGIAVDRTLGAVLGVGNPTESIFQLTMADRAAGATGTGQQPDSPGTLEKSFPVPNAFPLDINILNLYCSLAHHKHFWVCFSFWE